jgi:hypothetical protein
VSLLYEIEQFNPYQGAGKAVNHSGAGVRPEHILMRIEEAESNHLSMSIASPAPDSPSSSPRAQNLTPNASCQLGGQPQVVIVKPTQVFSDSSTTHLESLDGEKAVSTSRTTSSHFLRRLSLKIPEKKLIKFYKVGLFIGMAWATLGMVEMVLWPPEGIGGRARLFDMIVGALLMIVSFLWLLSDSPLPVERSL